jgi:hypothetical protein
MTAILSQLAPYALTLLAAAGAWVAVKLAAYLSAKAKSSKLWGVLEQVSQLVFAVVSHVEAETKPLLLLVAGGQLKPEDYAKLKAAALKGVKDGLGAQGLATLKGALSVLVGLDVDVFLSGKIEQAVATLPK